MTLYRGSRSWASGQPEPPSVCEGSSVPEMVADTGPGAEGHRGVQPYYLCCAPTVLLHFPPPQPGSRSHLCPGFCLWSPHSGTAVGTPASSPQSASRLSSSGKAGEHFHFVLAGGFPLAMPPPLFSLRTSTLNGSCVTKALGTVTLTPPAEGACALILLTPPVLETHFQSGILESSASGPFCPPRLPGPVPARLLM